MSTVLRGARAADVPAMAEVFVSAWRAGYGEVVPADVLDRLDTAETAGWLTCLLGDRAATTVVAVVDGTVAGFARFGADPDRPGTANGYLAALYVHPAVAGRGVGGDLLRHAVASLEEAGRPDVRLWVFEANDRARRLYEGAGFGPDGTRTVDPRWRTPQVGYRRRGPRPGRQASGAS